MTSCIQVLHCRVDYLYFFKEGKYCKSLLKSLTNKVQLSFEKYILLGKRQNCITLSLKLFIRQV